MIASWPFAGSQEYALSFDQGRRNRLLIIPALFDEANRTRRLIVEVMRRLDGAGIDTFLPDLPGCNESLAALESLTLSDWRQAMLAAGDHFRASHVLSLRAGAVLVPTNLTGWRYAPSSGAQALKGLLRGRVIAAREAGRDESTQALLELGRAEGLDLSGYRLGAEMVRDLEKAMVPDSGQVTDIAHADLGAGGGLWLRAEPDYDPAQADALAAILSLAMAA